MPIIEPVEGIWLHRFSLTEGSTLVRWPESAVRTLLGANETVNSGGLQLLESCLGVIPIMQALSPVISKSKASMLQVSPMWTGSSRKSPANYFRYRRALSVPFRDLTVEQAPDTNDLFNRWEEVPRG